MRQPILFGIKKRGYEIIVCGSLENDPCHKYADKSVFLDYSKKEDVALLVKDLNIDFVVPTCNDYSYLCSSYLADKFGFYGFDSFDVSEILHTKNAFRKITENSKIPTPKAIEITEKQIDNSKVNLQYPLLVKPVDSFSGRGVTKIFNPNEIESAIKKAIGSSKSSSVVVEEFKEGTLHSHSAFIRNGEIIFDVFVDEYCTVYPYQVDCSNIPSLLTESLKNRVRESMLELISLLNLCDGLLHTQFIAHNNEFWIIECMRRCPGDLYNRMVQLSTNIDYIDYYIRPFLGELLPDKEINNNQLFYGRHTISTFQPLVHFSFSHNIPGKNFEMVQLKQSGEYLEAAPYDKLAIVFAEFFSYEEMINVTPKFTTYISINSL